MAVTVYLVPVGRGHYELYSEPAGHADAPTPDGYLARKLHAVRTRWREALDSAHDHDPRGRFARWRGEVVRRLAESVAEQRALWSLRNAGEARLVHPSDLDEPAANATLKNILVPARRHHGLWLVFDTAAFVLSGLLMLVPGPNLVAYYFAFRLLGHYFSWRGARQALDRTRWTAVPEPALSDLAALAPLPCEEREADVEKIAARLQLPRLTAFFNRAAVPNA